MSMADVPTKPYLIRAIAEWCNDAGFTPYVAVAVEESVRVPQEFVKNGEIVLNISSIATHRLMIDNEAISFQARFGGVARDVYIPMAQVIAVYARENGQGMAFEVPRALKRNVPPDEARGHSGSSQGNGGSGAAPQAGPRLRAVEALAKNTVTQLPTQGDADNASSVDPDAPTIPARQGQDPKPDAPPPTGGDRPRLTRIK